MDGRWTRAGSEADCRREKQQIRWMMGLWRTARLMTLAAVLAPLIGGAFLVVQAYLLAGVLHAALVEGSSRESLIGPIALIAGLIAVRAILSFGGDIAGARAAETIKFKLREALFEGLLSKPTSWTASRSSGALVGLMVDQVEALEGFFARYLPAMIAAAILPLAFAVVVMPLEPVIGLLFFLTAPLIPVFMALVGWGAEAASRLHVQAFTRLSGLFVDRLRGVLTLKMFGRAEAEADRIDAASEELRQRTLGVLKVAFLSSAVLEFFAALGVAGVALYVGLTYLGLIDLRASPLTLQVGLFCLLMAPEVYFPLRQLAINYHDRAAAKAAIAELDALFGELPSIGTEERTVGEYRFERLNALTPIKATQITLRTPDGSRGILDSAAFVVKHGEHIAIVGTSGIGKSSFIEALARLRGCEGSIKFGERTVQEIGEAELRHRVMFLGQRPRLFQGSISHNIRLGRMDATDEEVRAAAGRAAVSLFANKLADGLETIVGEDGEGLSGGEAHRVALARIFLRNPDIVILDEPTAHLDEETESAVVQAIRDFSHGRTLIVATHSFKVAAAMDRVVRIEDGRIVEVTGDEIPAETSRRKAA